MRQAIVRQDCWGKGRGLEIAKLELVGKETLFCSRRVFLQANAGNAGLKPIEVAHTNSCWPMLGPVLTVPVAP